MNDSELRERISDVQHDIWSHWMRWQFSVSEAMPDGSVCIPASRVER